MLEENEETLEQWYFLEYTRGLDDDLYNYFCIEKLAGRSDDNNPVNFIPYSMDNHVTT